jgi:hypothetical protein
MRRRAAAERRGDRGAAAAAGRRVTTLGALAWLVLLGCAHQHPAGGLPDSVAALLVHVPADTPYAFVALEPLPPPYLEHELAQARKQLAAAKARLDALGAARSPDVQRFQALIAEIEPYLSIDGLTRLGIGPSPRSVLYADALLPVVRLQIADARALGGFIDRVVGHLGGPAATTSSAGRTWRFRAATWAVTVLLTETELVATAAPLEGPPALDASGDLLATPSPNLAESPVLGEILASYRFDRSFVGFIDTRRLLERLARSLGVPDAGVCAGEIAALAARAPRVVVGLDEVSPTRTRGRLIVELDPALARELAAVRFATPGVGAPLGLAIVSFGAAIDLPAAVDLLRRHARAVQAAPYRCALLAGLNEIAAELDRSLARPLPEPFGDVRGFAAVLEDYQSGGIPPKVRAEAVVAATDPIRLMSLAKRYAGFLPGLNVPPTGKPVALPLGPLTAYIAMQGRLLGVGVGDGSDLALVRLMSDRPLASEPILAFAYDIDRLQGVLADLGAVLGKNGSALAGLHGRIEVAAELAERGVVVRFVQEER